MALVHRDAAFPLLRERALHDVRRGVDGALAYFPAQTRRLRAWADEAAVSRLYGGIHFRSDNGTGLELGRKVGRIAIDRYRARALDRDGERR
jgi:hypothetical protein